MTGKELTADDAWHTVRACRWSIWAEGFVRFRYGDGFSHARALGLQLCLSFIPLVIALVGLSDSLAVARLGQVLRLTLLSLSPGGSDQLLRGVLARPLGGGDGAQLALWLGLVVAVIALGTGMGQVERGANRIYGIQRDRPGPAKYPRAMAMAFVAGVPAMVAFGLLIAGAAVGAVGPPGPTGQMQHRGNGAHCAVR
jgi:uncharacterized BrkB/YihY/UPF0761 family membrane protein